MSFPIQRLRRLRANPTLRRMARETIVTPDDLIAPLFVQNGENVREPIGSMPGQFRLSPDTAVAAAQELWDLGVPALILFGIPDSKDPAGCAAYDPAGPVPVTIGKIKQAIPEMCVIADVCACEYTSHGHCGILSGQNVDNDQTLTLLQRASVCYAGAGVDIVAPSDMMDGRVAAIRQALDAANYQSVPIMSYAAKFAGAFYGPFREAADSTPQFGDRRSYQMDIANRREARREIQSDVDEGADIILVKPALFCLDLIRDARENCDLPICCYNVSSEYSMIKAAGQNGWINEAQLIDEALLSMKRAGADLIITYHAKEWAMRNR